MFEQPSANDGTERRDSPRFRTRVIHRGQSGDTSQPRDSVEDEKDNRGTNQARTCHKREVSRLELEVGENKATSSEIRGISGTKRRILPEER